MGSVNIRLDFRQRGPLFAQRSHIEKQMTGEFYAHRPFMLCVAALGCTSSRIPPRLKPSPLSLFKPRRQPRRLPSPRRPLIRSLKRRRPRVSRAFVLSTSRRGRMWL